MFTVRNSMIQRHWIGQCCSSIHIQMYTRMSYSIRRYSDRSIITIFVPIQIEQLRHLAAPALNKAGRFYTNAWISLLNIFFIL